MEENKKNQESPNSQVEKPEQQPTSEQGQAKSDEEVIPVKGKRRKKTAIGVRRKKEFTYRGFTLEQLLKMGSEDPLGNPYNENLINIMPSRIRRTLKRGFNEEQKTFIQKLLKGNKPILKTHHRDIPILPRFVGKKIKVYNGKEWKMIELKPEMIGHYIGEFVLTRKFEKHSGPGVGATRSSKFMPLK